MAVKYEGISFMEQAAAPALKTLRPVFKRIKIKSVQSNENLKVTTGPISSKSLSVGDTEKLV